LVLATEIQFKPANVIEREEQEALTPATTFTVRKGLADIIMNTWETNRRYKTEVTERMLYCLRSRKGEYSPEEQGAILNGGGAMNPVYMKLTGTKCRAASAWIRDMMLPADSDYPFTIMPTPEPDINPEQKTLITQTAVTKAAQLMSQGQQMTPEEVIMYKQAFYDETLAMIQQVADASAKNMENRIKDKMAEGDWVKALEEFIEAFVTYPVAILKGPYYEYRKTLKWKAGKPTTTMEPTLMWQNRPCFDIYPSPYTDTLQKGNFIDKLNLSRAQLFNMIGLDGYNEDEIRAVIADKDAGNLVGWAWEESAREQLENSSYWMHDDLEDTVDALHFWGAVPGKDLKEWGVTAAEDDERYYEIDAILIGNHVIRAVINDDPLGARPYHSASWDAVPGSFYGVALPEQMEEHQRIVNTAARGIVENMALTSGAQVIVDVASLAPGEDVTNIQPKKIWQVRPPAMGTPAFSKPIDFFIPPSVSGELMEILERFENKADDVTNVPRYSYGNEKISGAGSTATGLGMLMQSAAKGIRRALAQIDAYVLRPTVYQTFVKLMLYDPDPMIKGDVKIIAKGSTALLIKENEQQRMLAFLRELGPYVGPNTITALAAQIGKLMDLNIGKELKADAMARQQAMEAANAQARGEATADSVAAQAQQNSAESQSQAQASMVQ